MIKPSSATLHVSRTKHYAAPRYAGALRGRHNVFLWLKESLLAVLMGIRLLGGAAASWSEEGGGGSGLQWTD